MRIGDRLILFCQVLVVLFNDTLCSLLLRLCLVMMVVYSVTLGVEFAAC